MDSDISLPSLPKTMDYEIIVVEVRVDYSVTGRDHVYALRNRKTGVVEGRGAELPKLLLALLAMQKALEFAQTEQLMGQQLDTLTS